MNELVLRHGDCLHVLADMPEASVGAVVCDPPYGLELMGENWDSLTRNLLNPTSEADIARKERYGRSLAGRMANLPDYGALSKATKEAQEWHREWLVACYRVLVPNGVLKAFSATRTFHRMSAAMQEAGFTNLHLEAWAYGCLSEDTEVLTPEGWVQYHRATVGTQVMGFDPLTSGFRWMPVEDTYEYEYDREAFRLVGSNTDHIVSVNHRCLVERGGGWAFVYAEELESTEVVPCVFVPVHPETQEAGGLQPTLCHAPQRREAQETTLGTKRGDADLLGVCEGVLEARCVGSQPEEPRVLKRVQRSEPWEGVGGARPQGCGGGVLREPQAWCGEDAGGAEPCMEGWCDLLQQEGELPQTTHQVRPVSRAIEGHVSQGRVCNGASPCGGASTRTYSDEAGGGSPCEPRRGRQPLGELDAVCVEQGAQVVRGAGEAHARVERCRVQVERVPYTGKVWCVKVATGAFVARRKGMAFVTGNSGFPKSKNLALFIDKALGATGDRGRAIPMASTHLPGEGRYGAKGGEKLTSNPVPPYVPVTPEAHTWAGWGTACKPSWEPVLVGRKPA